MSVDEAIGTLALVLGAGLVARLVADVARIPAMLLLLAAGAALGPSGLELVDAPLRAEGVQLLLTLGVSFILFHGGLHLSLDVLRPVALGLLLLVVVGVLIATAVAGSVAALVFGVPLLTGLLIGAAVAPTDPAILIPLFTRMRLRRRLSQTTVAESAVNDPLGAVLALALAAAIVRHDDSIVAPVEEFALDVGVSVVLGLVFGVALALVVSTGRFGLWRESVALVAVVAVATSFVSIDVAGGSGYLGAFLAGLIVANMDRLRLGMHEHHERELRVVASAISDVVVIVVFVVLGANIPFAAVADDLLPALAVVAALVLVARPLAIAVCLLPDRRARWTREELLFLVWTRETGVVPAALAALLLSLGVPGADHVTVTVAVALLVTVGLQSTTKPWLARRLRLVDDPPLSPPG